MKVLIVHNDFRVYWKDRLVYLERFLRSKKIEFYAVELFGQGSPYFFDTYDNKESWWTCLFPNNRFSDLAKGEIQKELIAKLDEINPDIVIGGSIVFFSGALGIRWAKNNGRKFIMFDDAKPSHIKRNFFVQWVKDLITEQIDGLWLPSKDYDQEYSNLNQKDTLFFHGYNCIDNDLFKFKGAKDMSGKTLICVARLVSIKNIDNLLRAWSLVEKEYPDYNLSIIGDGAELGNLTVLKSDLGLKTVNFLGAISNNEIPAYFNKSVAFILPSHSESWGLVVNEAMAAGLPILLSNKINAATSLLREGINGFSFEPSDVEGMSGKILNFIKLDEASKKAMSKASLDIINTMNYENMGNELLTAIHQLNKMKNKKPGKLASSVINTWRGRYNTAGWDKLEPSLKVPDK